MTKPPQQHPGRTHPHAKKRANHTNERSHEGEKRRGYHTRFVLIAIFEVQSKGLPYQCSISALL